MLTFASERLSVIIDNSANASIAFKFSKTAKVRVLVGLNSSLVANLNASSCLFVELLLDRAANVDIAFVNVLSAADVEMSLKLRANSHALVRVSVAIANRACVNTINALALGRRVNLKLVYDILLLARAPISISPRFATRDKLSLFIHAVSVSCLSCCAYCNNRLINALALAALSSHSLCTTRFG